MLGTKTGLADSRKFLRTAQGCLRLDRVHNNDAQATLEFEDLATTAHHYKTDWGDHIMHICMQNTKEMI